jgi:hypothetical protein
MIVWQMLAWISHLPDSYSWRVAVPEQESQSLLTSTATVQGHDPQQDLVVEATVDLRLRNPPLTPPRRGTGKLPLARDVPLLGGVRGGSASTISSAGSWSQCLVKSQGDYP